MLEIQACINIPVRFQSSIGAKVVITISLVVLPVSFALAQGASPGLYGMVGDSSLADSASVSFDLPSSGGETEVNYYSGILPFYTADNRTNAVVVRGNVGVSNNHIPVKVDYRYSTVRNPFGPNNYLNFSLDKGKLDKINDLKDDASLFNLEGLKSRLKKDIELSNRKLAYKQSVLERLEGGENPVSGADTISQPQLQVDTLGSNTEDPQVSNYGDHQDIIDDQVGDSLVNGMSTLNVQDSISRLQQNVSELKNRQQELKEKYDQVNEKIELIKEFKDFNGKGLGDKLGRFLSRFNDIQVGVTNPSIGTFLLDGVPVLGFSGEYFHRDLYLSTAVGNVYTVSGFMQQESSRTSSLLRQVGLVPNYDGRRWAGAIKGGVGGKTETHAHLGLLSASSEKGKSSASSFSDTSNNVVEADLRYQIDGVGHISLVAAKTLERSAQVPTEQSKKETQFIAESAGEANISLAIPKVNTLVTGRARYTGKDFYSAGVFFLRPDFIEYDFSINQSLPTRTNISAGMSNSQDGFSLHRFSRTRFQKYDFTIRQGIGRRLSINAGVAPLMRSMEFSIPDSLEAQGFELEESSQLDRSWLYSGGFTYSIVSDSLTVVINGTGQFFDMSFGDRGSKTYVGVLTTVFETENMGSFTLSNSYLESSEETNEAINEVRGNVRRFVNDLSYSRGLTEGISATARLRALKRSDGALVFGGGLGCQIQLPWSLNLGVNARYVALDSDYLRRIPTELKYFPYSCNVSLKRTW